MPLFVLFVFGSVILGAGAMLSPAWPTRQPRVALAAAMALAIIVGGAVFYAALVGWDTLVVDYLLFALVVGIFLGGTLSGGQTRAEKQGEAFSDAEQGWPGPQDLAFLAVIALVFALPVFILPVPFGTDGQQAGYLALTAREGSTFNTLAPYHPEIVHLYAPGFSALTAYLSQQLDQPIHTVQFSVGAVLALLNVWLAYDFGAEWQNKRLGRVMALAMLLGLGVMGMLLQAQFAALMSLAFLQAFILYAVRYLRHVYPADLVGAGLMLGATLITSPTMTVIALLGFVSLLVAAWLVPGEHPQPRQWVALLVGVPVIMLLSTAPWLSDVASLWDEGLAGNYTYLPDNLSILLDYHGIWLPVLAVVGVGIGWMNRSMVAMMAAIWLFLIVDFSSTGGIARLFPFVNDSINPADVAWFGPVLPYSILGGMALLWIWELYIAPRIGGISYRQSYVISAVIGVALLLIFVSRDQLLAISKDLLNWQGALATEADIEAMRWLEANTPEDSRVLNFMLDDGLWAPVITERDTVFRPDLPLAEMGEITSQAAFTSFWLDPAAYVDVLQAVDYIVVPQMMNNPDVYETSWRWQPPRLWELTPESSLEAVSGLELAFEADGAQVYEVLKTKN